MYDLSKMLIKFYQFVTIQYPVKGTLILDKTEKIKFLFRHCFSVKSG